jgi:PAS domain S-box-containing protein
MNGWSWIKLTHALGFLKIPDQTVSFDNVASFQVSLKYLRRSERIVPLSRRCGRSQASEGPSFQEPAILQESREPQIAMNRYRVQPGAISAFLSPGVRRFPVRASLALILVAMIVWCARAAQIGNESPAAQEPKRILLVYVDEMSSPAERAVDRGIRSVFGAKLEYQLYSEHLDTALFPDPKFQAAQAAWYRSKYRDRKIALIVAIGLEPREFLPGIPTIFCGLDPAGLPRTTLPANSTAVWMSVDFKRTLAAAVQLQPTAKQIVIIVGTAPWDRHIEAAARNALSASGAEWEIHYWDNLSLQETRSRLAKLPRDAIVLFTSMDRDGAGQPHISRDIIPVLSAASTAPIYGLSDGMVGYGIVGGSVVSFEAQGKQVAEIGRRILQGEKPADIPPAFSDSSYQFDWRQLQRFGLRESTLPPGSAVKFVVLSPWQLYKRWILAVAVFLLFQSVSIFYLLVQRHRRRRAESRLGYELEFESLVSDLSGGFATVPTERTDTEIEKALQKLREFLVLDRVCVYETGPGDDEFQLRFSAGLQDTPASPRSFSRREFPWLVSNLTQGRNSVMRRGEDLPLDARKEQAYLVEKNHTFVAIVPMRAAGLTVGSLAFASFHEGTWSDKVIQQFQIVAEVFAHVLSRKRIEDGLQESQQRFQAMADTAPVMIWMSGPDKLRTFFNKQWLEFTGKTLEQEQGDGWADGVHNNDLEHCLRTHVSGFDARLPFSVEYRLRRANGTYGWIFDTGVPRYTPGGEFTGYIGSCVDITDRILAERGVADLSGRLISAQEDERSRISRELHDDFSQRLALLAIQIGQASQSLPDAEKVLSKSLHAMWERTTELAADIHKMSHQLHSSKLQHLGLLPAAKSLCEEIGKQHRIQIEFLHRDMPEEISPDMALCFFRIVQEALNNIVKHSGATQAHVAFVATPSLIRLRIVDAGAGFDPTSMAARGGLGLASMRERLRLLGGTIALQSSPMEGTEIVAEVPMTHARAEAFRMNLNGRDA